MFCLKPKAKSPWLVLHSTYLPVIKGQISVKQSVDFLQDNSREKVKK